MAACGRAVGGSCFASKSRRRFKGSFGRGKAAVRVPKSRVALAAARIEVQCIFLVIGGVIVVLRVDCLRSAASRGPGRLSSFVLQ